MALGQIGKAIDGKKWMIYQSMEKNEWFTNQWKKLSGLPINGKNWFLFLGRYNVTLN
jgi:hypothetical protein